ncbi:MAG: carbamate kinase [Actinomycetota bacterium]
MLVVVALGGNAIQRQAGRGTIDEQREAIRATSDALGRVVAAGNDLVVTHGNGPQVGRMMDLDESSGSPHYPLDVHVAETQGQIGYLLQQELGAAFARASIARSIIAVVTQVVVDPMDQAFLFPSKPVGPFLDEPAAAALRARGEAVKELSPRTWRRVVPSPSPLEIVEAPSIASIVHDGIVPIACGGGGIPVVREDDRYHGVPAVIDKDLAAACLIGAIGGDVLLILTDVPRVELHHGTARAEPLDRLPARDARQGVANGEFPAGSMGPKVLAAAQAAEHGARAIIASLADIDEALAGRAGTEVVA